MSKEISVNRIVITPKDEAEAIDIAIKALTEQPKEKWMYCSECEWDKKDAELVSNIPTNYCPNCGADMRGDNK